MSAALALPAEVAAEAAASEAVTLIVATAGVALLVIGAIALGVYLYNRSQAVPAPPQLIMPCPLWDPDAPRSTRNRYLSTSASSTSTAPRNWPGNARKRTN